MHRQSLQLLAAARQLLAKDVLLDLAWVEGLRRDFLTLLKNLPKVKDYQEADLLREALKTFSGRFNELFFDHFLNNDMKYHLGISEADAKWYDKQLRGPAWEFYIELRLPMGYAAQAGDEFSYGSPEAKFEEFKQRYPSWKARVQRKAREFWKVMDDFIAYYERQHGSAPVVHTPNVDTTELEGFQLIVRDFKPEDEYNQKELEILKEGLRIYRRRASAVFPLLLKKMVPLTVEFKSTLDKGGTYGNGMINMYASSLLSEKGPPWVAHVLAHEMGHHLFRTYLSDDAKAYWYACIRGDWGPLDLQELLDRWPGDTWAFDFPRVMGGTDPILALQVDAVSHDPESKDLQSKEDFQKLLDRGTKTLVVPQTPITGYANKNPEEAFCEALGLLVAYGPRALHERVRLWLDTALPGVTTTAHVSTLRRMAAPRPMKEEKIRALLLKLRKGSGWGSIKGRELGQVLQYLGGWKIDELPTLEGMGSTYYRARDLRDAKATHDAYKSLEVQDLPSQEEVARLPLHTRMYQDVQDVVQNPEYPTEIGFYYRGWLVSTGVIFTSPDGQVLTSTTSLQGFMNDYPQNFRGKTQDGEPQNLMGWLTEDTGFLTQVSDRLGLDTYEAERRKEKALRTREHTGTCPCCFGDFKLTPRAHKGNAGDLPGMVLHGYQRPGIGYVLGNCFGQDYPPFELSAVGTVDWRAAQQKYLESQEQYLERLNDNDVNQITVGNRTYKRSETPEAEWGRVYLREINDLKGRIKSNQRYIADLDKEIAGWSRKTV